MRKLITVILASTFLCSCTGINPNSLRPSSASTSLLLPETVSWNHTDKNIRFNTSYKLELEPGKYIAVYEDDVGRFYRGSPGCLTLKIIEEKDTPPELSREIHEFDCAIYVPFNSSEPARAFIFNQAFRKRYIANNNQYLSSNTQEGVQKAATQAALTTPATPLAAGIGAGIGTGIVNGIIAADSGRLTEYSWNDPAGIPRSKFLLVKGYE